MTDPKPPKRTPGLSPPRPPPPLPPPGSCSALCMTAFVGLSNAACAACAAATTLGWGAGMLAVGSALGCLLLALGPAKPRTLGGPLPLSRACCHAGLSGGPPTADSTSRLMSSSAGAAAQGQHRTPACPPAWCALAAAWLGRVHGVRLVATWYPNLVRDVRFGDCMSACIICSL